MRAKGLSIVILGLVFFVRVAAAEESMKLIGVGAVISDSPYKGVGTKTTPLPLIRTTARAPTPTGVARAAIGSPCSGAMNGVVIRTTL